MEAVGERALVRRLRRPLHLMLLCQVNGVNGVVGQIVPAFGFLLNCNHGAWSRSVLWAAGSATCGTAYKSRRRDVAVGSSVKRGFYA